MSLTAEMWSTFLHACQNFRDRKWRLRVCEVSDCTADTIEITEDVEPNETTTSVVAVASSVGCAGGVTYYTGIGHGNEVSESRSVTTTETEVSSSPFFIYKNLL